MGRRDDYLSSDDHWWPSFTRKERLERWWPTPSFGLALSGKASRAVGAAQSAVDAAEAARDLVLHQAVYALLDEGETVREISGHLGLSKTHVGRIAKALARDEPADRPPGMGPRETREETRALVLKSWQLSNLDAATHDHPRGTHEPTEASEVTNFGGTNSNERPRRS